MMHLNFVYVLLIGKNTQYQDNIHKMHDVQEKILEKKIVKKG